LLDLSLSGRSFRLLALFSRRPSANGYDGLNSGGSNLGPTNRRLIDGARKRAERIREENGLAPARRCLPTGARVGSGLDPHISLGSVLLQVPRVARARGVDRSVIMRMAETACEKRYLNRWGDPYVNVLKLNRALDDLESVK
jgi:K+-transporting ATPase ATPase C chain